MIVARIYKCLKLRAYVINEVVWNTVLRKHFRLPYIYTSWLFSTITKDNVHLWCRELCLQIHRWNKELTCTRPISDPRIPYAFFLGILVRIYILSSDRSMDPEILFIANLPNFKSIGWIFLVTVLFTRKNKKLFW